MGAIETPARVGTTGEVRLIVIGGSKGALKALQALLADLPADFPIPVAIVVHRLPDPESRLVDVVQRSCPLAVEEPHDKQPILAGKVWLAPADYHLLVERGHFALSTDVAVTYARPSIDVLFESAADAFGSGVLAVLLTGNNADGSAGLARVRAAGGTTLVENPGTANAPVMPASAIRRDAATQVWRLADLAGFLVGSMERNKGEAR